MIGSGIGDVIDPMADAAYYQGSFNDQTAPEINTDFKSQGSDERIDEVQNEDDEQTPVVIQDTDEMDEEGYATVQEHSNEIASKKLLRIQAKYV